MGSEINKMKIGKTLMGLALLVKLAFAQESITELHQRMGTDMSVFTERIEDKGVYFKADDSYVGVTDNQIFLMQENEQTGVKKSFIGMYITTDKITSIYLDEESKVDKVVVVSYNKDIDPYCLGQLVINEPGPLSYMEAPNLYFKPDTGTVKIMSFGDYTGLDERLPDEMIVGPYQDFVERLRSVR